MSFENSKKICLEKQDKSKIGGIDKEILNLVNIINSKENYYTTSSCAGRITLLMHKEQYRKNECEWLLQSHDIITFEQAKEALNKIKPEHDVWLKMESAIMHIACKTIDDASNLLNLFKPHGFKRSGINSIGNKIILEIMTTDRIDTIVAKNGDIIIDDNYLKIVIEESNKKLKNQRNKIKKMEEELKK